MTAENIGEVQLQRQWWNDDSCNVYRKFVQGKIASGGNGRMIMDGGEAMKTDGGYTNGCGLDKYDRKT